MRLFVASISLLVTLIAIYFGIIGNGPYSSLHKPKHLGTIRADLPSKPNEFGRYKKPFPIIDYSWVSPKLCNFVSLKHWDFKSVSTSHYFIAVGIGNFNYVANAFVYVIDRTNWTSPMYHYLTRSILAQAIKDQAKSSIDGCTHFRRSSFEFIRSCYNPAQKVFEIDSNVPIKNSMQQLSFDFQMKFSNESDESMVLLYPVQDNRPAYTHKIAALPVRGKMKIGDGLEEELIEGVGSVDWTLAYFERISRWKWTALSALGTNSSNNEPVTIGINLSDVVYNDEQGTSMENAVWINGRIYTVNRVIYELPKKEFQISQPWQIYSSEDTTDAPTLTLTFQPWDSQEKHVNAIIVAADFLQILGLFNGTIQLFGHMYVIENGFGMMENHYAKW